MTDAARENLKKELADKNNHAPISLARLPAVLFFNKPADHNEEKVHETRKRKKIS